MSNREGRPEINCILDLFSIGFCNVTAVIACAYVPVWVSCAILSLLARGHVSFQHM